MPSYSRFTFRAAPRSPNRAIHAVLSAPRCLRRTLYPALLAPSYSRFTFRAAPRSLFGSRSPRRAFDAVLFTSCFTCRTFRAALFTARSWHRALRTVLSERPSRRRAILAAFLAPRSPHHGILVALKLSAFIAMWRVRRSQPLRIALSTSRSFWLHSPALNTTD